MNLHENNHLIRGPEEFGAHLPITSQENFVNGLYSSVDEAIASGLDRLRSEEGFIPTCKLGCSHCCRFHILTNIAEGHTLAQYIKREWTIEQINDLQRRTRQWHEWDNSRPCRYPAANMDQQPDLTNYDPCCPLLVNGQCSAYSVRPVACRTHFVCSNPKSCQAANDPESTEEAPVVLRSVVMGTTLFSMALRDYIGKAGLEFSESLMLLPQGLAIEMNWDFALSL